MSWYDLCPAELAAAARKRDRYSGITHTITPQFSNLWFGYAGGS